MTNIESVIAIRKVNPCATLQAISAKVGVSKQRVSQILKKEGLPTVHWKQTYNCNQCGNIIPSDHKYFCNHACEKAYNTINNYVTLKCEECGHSVKRRIYQERRNLKNYPEKKVLCAHCSGKLLGRDFGFGVYPEHRKYK